MEMTREIEAAEGHSAADKMERSANEARAGSNRSQRPTSGYQIATAKLPVVLHSEHSKVRTS